MEKGFEIRKIYMKFIGPKGNDFGQEYILEIKVNLLSKTVMSEEEIFRAAI
jgi:hypothetical protein